MYSKIRISTVLGSTNNKSTIISDALLNRGKKMLINVNILRFWDLSKFLCIHLQLFRYHAMNVRKKLGPHEC